MILVKNLKKTFVKDGNNIEVLKGMQLSVRKGESLALLGVSGAGKSTLIHILGALDHPTSGEVLYDNVNIFTWSADQLAAFRNRKIGFVFQLHNLLPEFSALENTMMPALIMGSRRADARAAAEEILTFVGLKDRLTHRQSELSGGEQQRVAVARALVLKPELVLADEPTGNLDSRTGEAIFELLMTLNRQLCITVVLVTHNESMASRIPRRITLADGRMCHSS